MKKGISKRVLWLLAASSLLMATSVSADAAYIRHTTDIYGNTGISGGGGAYQLLPGQGADITGPDGTCKHISNVSQTYSLYVPVNSLSEWLSFRSSGGFALFSGCGSPPPGISFSVGPGVGFFAHCRFGVWTFQTTVTNSTGSSVTFTRASADHPSASPSSFIVPANSSVTQAITSVTDPTSISVPNFCSIAINRIDNVTYSYVSSGAQQALFGDIEYLQ